jgi:hypothetical protein
MARYIGQGTTSTLLVSQRAKVTSQPQTLECRELEVSTHLCHWRTNMSWPCAALDTRNVPGSYFRVINRNNIYISFMNNSNCKRRLRLRNKPDRQVISNSWSTGHKSQSSVSFIHLLLKQIKFNYQSQETVLKLTTETGPACTWKNCVEN